MPLFRAPDGRLILFAHVPKAGGSSIEDHLEARFGPALLLDRTWSRGATLNSSLGSSPQHVTADDLDRMGLTQAASWCFAVVRDPLSRAISEFRYTLGDGVVSRRRRLTRRGFSIWFAAVTTAMRHDPRIFDNHLLPQTEMVPTSAEVFRLEDGLDAVITRLDALFGPCAYLAMPHALAGARHVQPKIRRRDVELARQVYAADYDRFGYPLPEAPADAPSGALHHMAGRLWAGHIAGDWRRGLL